MPVEPHDLHHDFPEFNEKIHQLKTGNNHFRKLFDEYDALDHEIRNIENAGQNTGDEYLEGLKRRRLRLKDELYVMLQAA